MNATEGGATKSKSNVKRTLLILAAVWIGGIVVLGAIYGLHGTRNKVYEPQNEFKLESWVHLGDLLDQQGGPVPGAGGDR